MIGVGINNNVVVIGAKTDDKGRLVITLEEAANVGKEKLDVFDKLSSASVDQESNGFNLNIFPFKKPSGPKNETKTTDELIEMVSDDMGKVKNQLHQLLEQYMVSDDIKWDPYQGTGITKENYRTKFLEDDALASVFANYSRQFCAMIQPFLGNPVYKLRVKLIRQSKDKHYASVPGRFLKDNPWVDLMEVPEANSKVKFTAWEIGAGLNDGTPVSRATADATANMEPAAAVTSDAAGVFGNR